MKFLYLLILCVAISCLMLIDARWKLAWFHDYRRTLLTIIISVTLFLIWDIFGIKLGIFFEGNSRYITQLFIVPHVPIEELFFLTLLSYNALIIYRLGEKKWQRT